jgi:hypothetical protein
MPRRAFIGETEEMKQRSMRVIVSILSVFVSFSISGAIDAAELRIPPLSARAGQEVEVPVTIDEVENLAGVKLVVSYDPEVLVFKKGSKTKQTDSLMHVVNDKKPGQIIVVMAGARGIKGKDIPIFTLTFDVKAGLKGKHSAKIGIAEAQLMTDQLKEVKCSVVVDPIAISP